MTLFKVYENVLYVRTTVIHQDLPRERVLMGVTNLTLPERAVSSFCRFLCKPGTFTQTPHLRGSGGDSYNPCQL